MQGDRLAKGLICKVCERKFQMHMLWHREVPIIEQGEERIRVVYQEHKRKLKDLETVKKEC